MAEYKLLTTRGVWYDEIENGKRKFDFGEGYRDIVIGDSITFVEAESDGTPTGEECTFIVTCVVHSRDFPSHFRWDGEEFTIIQFEEKDAEMILIKTLDLITGTLETQRKTTRGELRDRALRLYKTIIKIGE